MGSIFSSTSLPKEEQKEDGWVIVDEEEALAEANVEQEEEEEEEEYNINYPSLPHPEYNPWPWSGGLPCPAEVEYWSCTNGVVLTEAQLQAWARIAQQYGLKNEY
jgi:hypothetical protein